MVTGCSLDTPRRYQPFVSFQCCFTSTETIKLIRDGKSRTATSTFTQLLGSDYSDSQKAPALHQALRQKPFPGSV